MTELHVEVVYLQSGVGAVSRKPNNVVNIVIDFHPDFSQRMVVVANIVHHKHIAFDL